MASSLHPSAPAAAAQHIDPNQLLDKARLATSMGVSVRLLDELVSSGRLPKGVRVGRRLYWTSQAVDAWRQRTFSQQLHWRP